MFESEDIFHLSSKLCTLQFEDLRSQSNNKEIKKWILAHGSACLTNECNIGPSDRQKAILARARSPRSKMLSGSHLGPILYPKVKYSGPYKKNHLITSNNDDNCNNNYNNNNNNYYYYYYYYNCIKFKMLRKKNHKIILVTIITSIINV